MTTTIFTSELKKTNDSYPWAVCLNGKPLVWNREQSDSDYVAKKWNTERVKTAREIALTPHNLDRKGNTATTPSGEVWVWQNLPERFVRIK